MFESRAAYHDLGIVVDFFVYFKLLIVEVDLLSASSVLPTQMASVDGLDLHDLTLLAASGDLIQYLLITARLSPLLLSPDFVWVRACATPTISHFIY